MYRTAITVPEKSWGRLRDIIEDFCEKMEGNNSEVREIGPVPVPVVLILSGILI
jgi:hypothetical protein